MDYSVRPANEGDLPAIERLEGDGGWEPASYLLYDVQVAEAAGEVIGFIASRTVGDEGEVLNLVVDPAWRRRGVATRLLETVKAPELFLEVRVSNSPARSLYSKLGFLEQGRRRDYYVNPIENAIVMRLSRTLKRVKT